MRIQAAPHRPLARPQAPRPAEEAPTPPPFQKVQRPAQLLERLPDGRLRIGNVRNGFTEPAGGGPFGPTWEPRWTEIVVDPRKIVDCSTVVEPFAPEWAAGHVMTLFEFSEPIPGLGSNKLVLSMEARLREGQSYNMWKGIQKTFQPVYQLCSLGDRVQKSCKGQGHRLIIHKLDLSAEQKEQMVRNGLETAITDHSSEWYHTTRNSCYTTSTDLLNTVLDKQIPRWLIPGIVERPSFALPVSAGLNLYRRGHLAQGPAVLIQPDQTAHPDKQVGPSKFKAMAQSPLWTPACTLAGAALGGAVGRSLAGLPGLAAGVLGGGYAASLGADFLKVRTNVSPRAAESYYPS